MVILDQDSIFMYFQYGNTVSSTYPPPPSIGCQSSLRGWVHVHPSIADPYLGLYVTRLPEDWTVTSLKGVRFTGLLLTSNRTGSTCTSMFFLMLLLIECKDKCSNLKKSDLQRDFEEGVLSFWGPPITPYPPPPPTHVYTVYLFTQGRGGGELTRDKVTGAIVHKAVREYQHDWLYLLSINSN